MTSTIVETAPRYLPAILRTAVPVLYGLLAQFGVTTVAAQYGIGAEVINQAIAWALTIAFYMLLRWAERYEHRLGWLLGYPAPPSYATGDVVAGDVLDVTDLVDENALDDAVLGDVYAGSWEYAPGGTQ